MKTCKTCDYWIRRKSAILNEDSHFFGDCCCEHIRSEYGEIYIPKRSHKASLVIEYWNDWSGNVYTGEDFGCVHWTREEEEDGCESEVPQTDPES